MGAGLGARTVAVGPLAHNCRPWRPPSCWFYWAPSCIKLRNPLPYQWGRVGQAHKPGWDGSDSGWRAIHRAAADCTGRVDTSFPRIRSRGTAHRGPSPIADAHAVATAPLFFMKRGHTQRPAHWAGGAWSRRADRFNTCVEPRVHYPGGQFVLCQASCTQNQCKKTGVTPLRCVRPALRSGSG